MIHIGRAGSKLGSFSEFEIRQGLKSGRFFLTDLGWKEGMENWAPLSQFDEFETPPEPMPPLPGEVTPDEADLAPIPGLPWDFRREIGFFRAFFQTVGLILLHPADAFARIIPAGSLAGPLLFNLIGAWAGAMFSATYLLYISRNQPSPPPNMGQIAAMFYATPDRAMEQWQAFLFFGWLFVTLSTFIASGIIHLMLMLAGGASKPYHVTLRVFCFTYGSVQLLQVFPVLGALVAPALLAVYLVIGLAIAHEVSVWRTVIAMGLFLAGFVFLLGLLVTLASMADTGIH
jgi:hypothetical protein